MIIAIDPGSISGAWARLPSTLEPATCGDLPIIDKGVNSRALFEWLAASESDVVIVERVGVLPGQGISSSANFMRSVGRIEACIACAGLRMELVTPQKWKAFYSLSGKASDPAVKEKARAIAVRLYPELSSFLARVKDTGRAEALLIAHYWMETRRDSAA